MSKLRIAVVRDWEQRVSQFLKEAIESPHREPEVCEDLLKYIMHLISEDRRAFKDKMIHTVGEILVAEQKKFNPKVITDYAPAGEDTPEEYR